MTTQKQFDALLKKNSINKSDVVGHTHCDNDKFNESSFAAMLNNLKQFCWYNGIRRYNITKVIKSDDEYFIVAIKT